MTKSRTSIAICGGLAAAVVEDGRKLGKKLIIAKGITATGRAAAPRVPPSATGSATAPRDRLCDRLQDHVERDRHRRRIIP